MTHRHDHGSQNYNKAFAMGVALIDPATEIHNLHIWGMSATETALTARLVIPNGGCGELLGEASHELHERFESPHATLQVECGKPPYLCLLAPVKAV